MSRIEDEQKKWNDGSLSCEYKPCQRVIRSLILNSMSNYKICYPLFLGITQFLLKNRKLNLDLHFAQSLPIITN